jgi:NAD(P)-dependent dehydrogenase (short-subunit alcohol dehydrogenase family)
MAGLILVTGGARGIGAAIALKLAATGHPVAVNYASDQGAAEALVAKIAEGGGDAAAFRADVGDPEQIPDLFARAVSALGPLAGLVNNAGISGPSVRIDERDPHELTRLFQVNVIGTLLCCKEAVRRLSTRHGGPGGAIVNIASVAARLGGLPGLAPYAATKGAIESFTRGLATEVGREGVRVNAVSPGMIATDMTNPSLAAPGVLDRISAVIPMGRVGAPDEIAEAVAWLMSPASSYVTGSVLTVSGGR